MKKALLIFVCCAIAAISFAQKENFDLINYTAPKGWKKDVTENTTSYTIVNGNTWCNINIVKSTTSKGDINQDFESEWQMVVKSYKPADAPQLNEAQEANGWKIKGGGSKFVFNNSDAFVFLTTATGYNRCASIVATTNSQDYLKEIEALLASVELIKPENFSQQTQVADDDKNSLLGTWGANASDNSNYRMKNGIMNYISRQYTFNGDGSYSFVSKAFDPLMDKILLGKENGNYQIIGSTISITPKKSVLEAWSKKNGGDDWGKLLSTQNIALEKATYQFTKHFFSGTQIWNLVLQSEKATQRDGTQSSNTSFKNAWYYGPLSANNLQIKLPGNVTVLKKEEVQKQTPTIPNGFAFTTTNFDDGWTSTVKEDWVEVTKGNSKVLLHYSNAITGKYYPDSDEGINAAWNNLIAPRYNDLQNYTAWYSTSILPRPYVIAANVTNKQSGKKVYVVLFQKGNTGWIEIISPDKNTFIKNFGVDNTTLNNYPDLKLFAALEKLATYNKFAIAATDLKGKWSDKFSASFFNYNKSDGQYAGTNTISIVINFNFTSATAYNWDGYSTNNAHSAGAAKTFKTKGSFKMLTNWQMHFSDIQGKAKTYNAYFSCFKGGRILWLQDKDYGDYNAYGKVE